MAKKIAKRDITAATRAINEQIDLIEEVRRAEGNREANACAMWTPTVVRMSNYIGLLIRAEAPLPERLVSCWRWYGAGCKWHAYNGLPHYLGAILNTR